MSLLHPAPRGAASRAGLWGGGGVQGKAAKKSCICEAAHTAAAAKTTQPRAVSSVKSIPAAWWLQVAVGRQGLSAEHALIPSLQELPTKGSPQRQRVTVTKNRSKTHRQKVSRMRPAKSRCPALAHSTGVSTIEAPPWLPSDDTGAWEQLSPKEQTWSARIGITPWDAGSHWPADSSVL